ncbi:hypothetical protein U5N28_19870, partial [Lysinibacillus telephonicus]|uniref:hypothetical protein n=1 Tax=Lysinibacillus telephonicus TaxID=1714840 RepID=UPI00397C8F6D
TATERCSHLKELLGQAYLGNHNGTSQWLLTDWSSQYNFHGRHTPMWNLCHLAMSVEISIDQLMDQTLNTRHINFISKNTKT